MELDKLEIDYITFRYTSKIPIISKDKNLDFDNIQEINKINN